MTFWEEFRSVLATLMAQRFRAFLTLLGIILGVGTLVVLSSLVAGAGTYMKRGMQQAAGEDVVTVSRRWNDEETRKTDVPLNHFDSRALATAPRLTGAEVLNQYSMRVPWGVRWGQIVWVVGTTPEALSFYQLEVEKGRFLSQGDSYGHLKVAVMGHETVSKLMPGETDPLGKELKLKDQRFLVVGILKKKAAMGKGSFRTWDGSVIVPETTFVERFAQSKSLREVVVKAPPGTVDLPALVRVADEVKAIVKNRHHNVQNFDVTDPVKNADAQKLVALIVGGLEAAVAGVCLGVGGINVMNIMLVTVTQRTREIGLRRALGATRGNIRRQFLTEALILSGVGGVLGVVGGNVLAWLIATLLNATLGGWPFVFMPLQGALGFVFSLVTGAAFGWYPAHKAANLSPIDCLRFE